MLMKKRKRMLMMLMHLLLFYFFFLPTFAFGSAASRSASEPVNHRREILSRQAQRLELQGAR